MQFISARALPPESAKRSTKARQERASTRAAQSRELGTVLPPSCVLGERAGSHVRTISTARPSLDESAAVEQTFVGCVLASLKSDQISLLQVVHILSESNK